MATKPSTEYSHSEWETLTLEQRQDAITAALFDEVAADMSVPIETLVRIAEKEAEYRG